MNNIRIKKMTHRCRCQVPGCKNRNALKISKRDDVNGRPMFLCPDCIEDIYGLYAEMFGGKAADYEKTEAKDDGSEVVDEITQVVDEITQVGSEVSEVGSEAAEVSQAKSGGRKRSSGAKK